MVQEFVRMAQIQRCHAGAKRIQKETVVRHHDNGAGIQSKHLFRDVARHCVLNHLYLLQFPLAQLDHPPGWQRVTEFRCS
jgi:hypothetical protein